MHTLPLSEIDSINKPLPLFIQSIEGGSYLALTKVDEERIPITGADGQPVRGANVSQLQSALSGYNWASVCMLQRAADDEMIGSAEQQGQMYEIPLDWSTENT